MCVIDRERFVIASSEFVQRGRERERGGKKGRKNVTFTSESPGVVSGHGPVKGLLRERRRKCNSDRCAIKLRLTDQTEKRERQRDREFVERFVRLINDRQRSSLRRQQQRKERKRRCDFEITIGVSQRRTREGKSKERYVYERLFVLGELQEEKKQASKPSGGGESDA